MVRAGLPSLRPKREAWERVVAASNATVLSTISNTQFDAYLLSESSLFVYDRSAVMITCGTTSLVSAVEEMTTFIAHEDVDFLMYERKNEYRPEDQPTDFDQDVARINRIFPGEVANLGTLEDHHVRLFHYARSNFNPPGDDMTLELLMHDLSPEARKIFGDPELSRERLYEATGINQILSGFQVDDFLFKPVGYSLNAIGEEAYYTFHVTPEEAFSYASFETNYSFNGEREATLDKVLSIFQPRLCSLVLFRQQQTPLAELKNYREGTVVDSFYHGYHVRFRNFTRT